MIKRFIGQYSGKNTIIHRLDARLKIMFTILLSIVIFSIKEDGYWKLVIVSFFIIVILILSLINPVQVISAIKPFVFIYLFIILMYYLFSRDRIVSGFISLWKFTLLILAGIMLTSTTTLSGLVRGIEKILTPLKFIKLNPGNIALFLSITIRFIPVFFLYGHKTKEAQLSRLSDLRSQKGIRVFLEKLINRMINCAATLSSSIEARCYDLAQSMHTDFIKLKMAKMDYIASAIFILFVAGVLLAK